MTKAPVLFFHAIDTGNLNWQPVHGQNIWYRLQRILVKWAEHIALEKAILKEMERLEVRDKFREVSAP